MLAGMITKPAAKMMEKFDKHLLERHECVYDKHPDFDHVTDENDSSKCHWGKHQRDKDIFKNEPYNIMKNPKAHTHCPNTEVTGQKKIPGRDFMGGHYVSDLW